MKNQRLIIFAVVLVVITGAVSFKFFSNTTSFDELPLEKINLPEARDGESVSDVTQRPEADPMKAYYVHPNTGSTKNSNSWLFPGI